MGATIYGRRALRRFERETGEQVVHAMGPYLTTVDHRHLAWTGERWTELEPFDGHCGLPTRLSSCYELFGDGGYYTGLMRGPCRTCGVGCGQLHVWDCDKLGRLLTWVNPDYWPRPVHRPRWLDDPHAPRSAAALMLRLAYTMDVPVEVLLAGAPRSDWAHWEDGTAAEWRRAANIALAEVAPSVLRGMGLDPDRFTVTYEVSPFDLRPQPHPEDSP